MKSRSGLVAAICLAASVLPISNAGATAEPDVGDTEGAAETNVTANGVEVVRLWTPDRYGTSLAVARELVRLRGGRAEAVVLASGESWADAAVAGPLAASLSAPVLLVPPGGLQTSAARPDLVEFLRSAGTRRVVILGSPDVLPNHEPSVLFGLGMLPRNIERVHGDDPVEMSIAVAARIGAPTEFAELGRTVIIASDSSVADAVAVGPLAAAGPFPLLLTGPDALDPRITAYLAEHDVANVVLVGGTAAIAPAVQEALEAADITVTRLAGGDRADTSRLAAELFEQLTSDDLGCASGPARIGLAPAQRPKLALTAGPLLGSLCAPLRFTDSDRLPPAVHNDLFLAYSRTSGAELHVFESASVLPDDVLDVTVPPVRIAAWKLTPGVIAGESQATLIVSDGSEQPRSYPETAVTIPTPSGGRPAPTPQWGPRGRFLAYRDLATHGLFVLDTDNGGIAQARYGDLVPEVLEESGLSWSPDGSRLLFSGIIEDESTLNEYYGVLDPPEFTAEVLLYDVRSQDVTRVTHNRGTDLPLSWSPDGSRFLYHSHGFVGARGEPFEYLTTLSVHDLQSDESWTLSHSHLHGARWSPDGNRVMYTCQSTDPNPPWTSEICVADADGTSSQRLTPSNCEECLTPRYSAETAAWRAPFGGNWAPSGDQAAYSAVLWKSDHIHEFSIQVHDFAAGRAQILLSQVLRDDAKRRVTFAGWLNAGEFLYESTYTCQFEHDASLGMASITRASVDSGEARVILEVPGKPSDFYYNSFADCPPTFGLSPDRNHLAVQYPPLELHAYSLQSGNWTEIIENWESIGAGTHLDGRCPFRWTKAGFLGTCDDVREVENAEHSGQ